VTKLIPVSHGAQGDLDSLNLGFALPNQIAVKVLQVAGKFSDDLIFPRGVQCQRC
jgi:hypothetical protein